MVESEGGGVGMVGTDEGGMERTDGGVLDLVAIHCHPVLVSPPRRVSLLPPCGMSTSSRIVVTFSLHLLAMLLSSCVVVLVLCHCHWLIVVLSCVSTRWVKRKVGQRVLTWNQ